MQFSKHKNFIHFLVQLYVEPLLRGFSKERLNRIAKALSKKGAIIVSRSVGNKTVAYAITVAICNSYTMKTGIRKKLPVVSSTVVMLTGAYGVVQEASDSANRLKKFNSLYYDILYREKVEMMYFLIEPVIRRTYYSNSIFMTDDEVVAAFMRLTG